MTNQRWRPAKPSVCKTRQADTPYLPPITHAEASLARHLRVAGFEVSHHTQVAGYWPDILIVGTQVLVEVDGGYHDTFDQQWKDRKRTRALERAGYTVIRCTNFQANYGDPEVINSVRQAVENHHP